VTGEALGVWRAAWGRAAVTEVRTESESAQDLGGFEVTGTRYDVVSFRRRATERAVELHQEVRQ